MMRFLFLVTPLVLALAGLAAAADQTILGKQLQVKDPKPGVDATKRTIVGQGLEKKSTNTIIGDPTTAGATLTVSAHGTTQSSQTYPLPAALWTAMKGGFKYQDTKLTAGPVKAATIKLAKGTFQLQAVMAGKTGGLSVVPPNLGTDGCVLMEITGGDRYHVLFPAAVNTSVPNPSIKKNDAKGFVMKGPTVEGVCSGACTPGAPGCGWEDGDVVTFPQVDWGSAAILSTTTPFSTVYPLGLLVGVVGVPNQYSILLSSGSATLAHLPTSGASVALTQNYVDPVVPAGGLFGGDLVALRLNVDFGAAGLIGGTFDLGGLYLCGLTSSVAINGSTVQGFVATANALLSGGSVAGVAIADAALLAAQLNAAFMSGVPSAFAHDHLSPTPCP